MNYYEILGLSYGASISDVKASFRQLAKLYHPDINPEGIEDFAKVLRAYETLSDPVLKQSYDYKLNYHQAQSQQQSSSSKPGKTWSFSEKELKRRQYYDEHIRKYAKQSTGNTSTAEAKPHYNEFRYILYATPLAVILFLIIMTLANRTNPSFPEKTNPAPAKEIQNVHANQLKTGDDPYGILFGESQYELHGGQKITVKNLSGKDIIVCLFTNDAFVRSFYVANGYSAEVPQLPDEKLFVKYCSGLGFDKSTLVEDVNVNGAFSKDLSFYKLKGAIDPKSVTGFTFTSNVEGSEKISPREFFKRMTHYI